MHNTHITQLFQSQLYRIYLVLRVRLCRAVESRPYIFLIREQLFDHGRLLVQRPDPMFGNISSYGSVKIGNSQGHTVFCYRSSQLQESRWCLPERPEEMRLHLPGSDPPSDTKLLMIVEQVLESPWAFCSSNSTPSSPKVSTRASLKP